MQFMRNKQCLLPDIFVFFDYKNTVYASLHWYKHKDLKSTYQRMRHIVMRHVFQQNTSGLEMTHWKW